ncbi:glycerophosphodiester phosphodiesterase [Mammaliicoccus stepanovicii]|uniref:Glycerophosphoryl diester phosphodiesterase n=1 Tax=Mammaliicoccus stepanovicii TaxID=643214 RepID=A0A239ZN13_9STAP|nr:glycerophosphodiester phosphodiesterase [Mammaliicoccus stepanovicii]PNZ79217.1 glycerophosphodiester phosphodiesterase [Mammaliicoccus stepanovicii]GGI41507.1 glycerophosphoryl diester phosphodiesterase [Mammaliicoccus stepanovicii]SNV72228.1 glycerophosphoryl diester phosphodiesterase [Mammaliicoccus stepanovicii]
MSKFNLLKTTGLVGGIVAGSWMVTKATSQVKPRTIKPFFTQPAPYVFAHRGGMALRPEHTRLAFDHALNYEVTGFEIDVRLTKDEELVVMHDDTVDRTSNGSGYVGDHTLEDLRKLDFGYHFKDINNEHPYRGNEKAKIITLKELLTEYPDVLINIDIKDHPETYAGSLAPSQLYRVISEAKAEKRVNVASFYDEQIERFNLYAQNTVALGTGQNEVAKAFFAYHSGFGHVYEPKTDTFQIPLNAKGLPLDSEGFIQYLTSLNIAVAYWVINQIDTMDELIQKGVHTIVTDRPDTAHFLIKKHY